MAEQQEHILLECGFCLFGSFKYLTYIARKAYWENAKCDLPKLAGAPDARY